MTSTRLRTINNYKFWKSDAGIDSVILYIQHHIFPPNLTTQKMRDSFASKFEFDWICEHALALHPGGHVPLIMKLFYAPHLENDNTNPYSMKLEVVRPGDRQQKMREIYDDWSKSLGVGKNQFYFQVSSKFLGITRNMTYGFLKSQGDYQVTLTTKKMINKPTAAKCSNEKWVIDDIELRNYGEQHFKFALVVVDAFSKKMFARGLTRLDAAQNLAAIQDIFLVSNTWPHIIQSDNGGPFKGIFREFFINHNRVQRLAGHPDKQVKYIYSKPYSPSTNGLAEGKNSQLRKKIRAALVRTNVISWHANLPIFVENINNQKNASTHFTPNEIWTEGYHPEANDFDFSQKITDHSTKEEKIRMAKTNIVKADIKMLQNSPHSAQLYVGDHVRIKLTAFREPREFATMLGKREKDDSVNGKKYNAIKWSITVYQISRVHHNLDVFNIPALEAIKRLRPNRKKLINPQTDTYELNTLAGDPVVRSTNRRPTNAFLGDIPVAHYVPQYFFGSDLQFIPNATVPPHIPENTARVLQINRF